MAELDLTQRQYLELEKLALGAFAPLSGFMKEDDFRSVVSTMRLASGDVFPLPVYLDIDVETASARHVGETVILRFDGTVVGEVTIEDIFTCDKPAVAAEVYGTADPAHPGVAQFYRSKSHFIGGAVRLIRRMEFEFSRYERTPVETRELFAELGWRSVAGFQTRNVPHRAHEYLQRTALELVDGLFIQPLVGYKKRGDFEPRAILAGYEALLRTFFPASRVVLGVLSTSMRYAGPREAVFHAIIRRNYGCTHFIVGRDHAGVGGYYPKYAAHQLTRQVEHELGIEILALCGPFHCRVCGTIATEKTCRHVEEAPGVTHEINGTDMRRLLAGDGEPEPHLMRPEVVASLAGLPLLIEEDDA